MEKGSSIFGAKTPYGLFSLANLVTLLRLGGSLAFFVIAAVRKDATANFIGLGIHWGGDVLDGFLARRLSQETILGAEIDIIADRIEVLFFFVNFLIFHPGLFPPIVLYILDFAFVDFYLSNQFTKFDIISPNYFDRVDRRVYMLNFSPPAKFINSTLVTLTLIFLPDLGAVAAVLAVALIVVKSASIARLRGLPKPSPNRADFLSGKGEPS